MPLFPLINAYMSTAAATTTTVTAIGPICFKCGTIKKSGKLSCCARGGSWFKNCGDNGDSNFEHTWVEGVQACKSPRLTESTTTSVTPIGPTCFKCGTVKKSGK